MEIARHFVFLSAVDGDMFGLGQGRADFMCPLYVENVPVVMKTELDAANTRIAQLERRLAASRRETLICLYSIFQLVLL